MRLLFRYILLFSVILTSQYCKAQHWFPNSANWKFNKQEQLSFPAHGYINYKVANDTILNGISTKTILVDTLNYNGNSSLEDSIYVYESNSNVYYWNGNQFKLMYNFNLGVGDTLAVEVEQLKCDSVSPIVIDSISHLSVNSDSIKVQHVSYTLYATSELGFNQTIQEKLIEKVGNESSFIFAPSCIIKDELVYTGLRCYNDDSISYKNGWWENRFPAVKCDSLIYDTTTGLQKIKKESISIYPNPTNDYITISELDNNNLKSTYIEIYNLAGKKVEELNLKSKEIINMKSFQGGIYFLRVYQDKNTFDVIKLIKR